MVCQLIKNEVVGKLTIKDWILSNYLTASADGESTPDYLFVRSRFNDMDVLNDFPAGTSGGGQRKKVSRFRKPQRWDMTFFKATCLELSMMLKFEVLVGIGVIK